MELHEKQVLFLRCAALIILGASGIGLQVTGAELWRPPELVAIYAKDGRGSPTSLHPLRLAIDLNAFRSGYPGTYLTRTEDYAKLGAMWKALHPDCRWGGDFKTSRPDGNHFSITYQGRE